MAKVIIEIDDITDPVHGDGLSIDAKFTPEIDNEASMTLAQDVAIQFLQVIKSQSTEFSYKPQNDESNNTKH